MTIKSVLIMTMMYIWTDMGTRRSDKVSCYGRNDEGFYATDSRTSSRAKVLSPSINGGIGDDVRDALSQFDYLNDYENSSLRERGREASYHF
uniref:Secreted protein n=1 Tax=Angiostrongylus cantonensis TaxID=6313 RepID=A0A0K0D3Y6_ANGCA